MGNPLHPWLHQLVELLGYEQEVQRALNQPQVKALRWHEVFEARHQRPWL